MNTPNPQAHVIQFIDYSNGIYAVSSRAHSVLIGGVDEVKKVVEGLNDRGGHTQHRDEDGEWSDSHWAFKTVPLWEPQ